MARSVFRPKRALWFRGFLAAAAASILVFAAWSWFVPWAPGRAGGLTFGTLASAVFVIDALYPMRRRLLGWPFGTAQRWLQFHIYGGVLAFLFVLLHMGLRLANGTFGWILLLVTMWAVMSGLVGVYLQK